MLLKHKKTISAGLIVIIVILGGWYLFGRLRSYIEATPGASTTLGFIRSANPSIRTVAFDDATWLSGKAGEDAAIKAGVCTENTLNECLPNDYYIQNESTTTAPLAIDPHVEITMQTLHEETEGVKPTTISFADFAKLIDDPSAKWNTLPYTITRMNGTVTKIAEVFVP
jgi:hypothetical protein